MQIVSASFFFFFLVHWKRRLCPDLCYNSQQTVFHIRMRLRADDLVAHIAHLNRGKESYHHPMVTTAIVLDWSPLHWNHILSPQVNMTCLFSTSMNMWCLYMCIGRNGSVEISPLIEISFEFSPLIVYLFLDGMYFSFLALTLFFGITGFQY